jgi:hypothetical protein
VPEPADGGVNQVTALRLDRHIGFDDQRLRAVCGALARDLAQQRLIARGQHQRHAGAMGGGQLPRHLGAYAVGGSGDYYCFHSG